MRKLLSAALCLLSMPLFADEGGVQLTRSGLPLRGVFEPGRHSHHGAPVYDLGVSDPVPIQYDTVLVQGELPFDGAVFEAARRAENGSWGAWTAGEIVRKPDGRFWASVRLPPGLGALRFRAIGEGASQAQPIRIYSFEALMRGEEVSSSTGEGAFVRARPASKPAVIARDDWRARPRRDEPQIHAPERISQHHTAGRFTNTFEESLAEVRFIQEYHMDARRFSDIGYHFLVDGAGRIFEGRPIEQVGAHVRRHNTGNIGISLLGNFHEPDFHRLTSAQRASVIALGKWLSAAYGINPNLYLGHRDQVATDCPGDLAYPELAGIRGELNKPSGLSMIRPGALPRADAVLSVGVFRK